MAEPKNTGWRAEMPSGGMLLEDTVACDFGQTCDLVDRANAELDAKDAEIARLKDVGAEIREAVRRG